MASSSMYVKILSRNLKLQARGKSGYAVASQQDRVEQYADKVLRSVFHMFVAGDISSGRTAVSKLLKHAENNAVIYSAASLTLAIGFLSLGEYETVVRTLSDISEIYNPDYSGLCDSLLVLSEAYAALGNYDEALHSARLAVDVAHDNLETSMKTTVVHLQSIIAGASECQPIGPSLSTSIALTTAYYNIACQLARGGFPNHSEWFDRAIATAQKFDIPASILQCIEKNIRRFRVSLTSLADVYDDPSGQEWICSPDRLHKPSETVHKPNQNASKSATCQEYPQAVVNRPKRLPWRPVSPFATSKTATVQKPVIRSSSMQNISGQTHTSASSSKLPSLKRVNSAPHHRNEKNIPPSDAFTSEILVTPVQKSSGQQMLSNTENKESSNNLLDVVSTRRNEAAKVIQSTGRMYIAKKKVSAVFRQKRFENRRFHQRIAATIIQKCARGSLCRQKLKIKIRLQKTVSALSEVTISGLHGTAQLVAEEMAEILASREKMKIIQSLTPPKAKNNRTKSSMIKSGKSFSNIFIAKTSLTNSVFPTVTHSVTSSASFVALDEVKLYRIAHIINLY